MKKHIVVIGGGIIGAALAYRLSDSCDVTLIDAGGPRATDASFGWINASFFLTPDHFHLRAAGLAAYTKLAKDLDLPLRETGCLLWDLDGPDFDTCRDQLTAFGYPCAELDAVGFTAREPAVAAPPPRSLHFSTEAVANPTGLTTALTRAAVAQGARILQGVSVTGINYDGPTARVATTCGDVIADDVVVAAGTGTPRICATLGIDVPMVRRPAYIVETAPIQPLIRHVLASPIGEIRQRQNGALMIPAAVAHQADTADSLDQTAQDAADATITRLQTVFPTVPLRWAKVTRADRPVPQDGLPIIGRAAAGPYVTVMHSGLTLAAVVADLAASEITRGPSNATKAQLASFRPERFST